MLILDGLLDIGVAQNVAPEASNLVSVVDLHDVELLQDLHIDASLLLLELWDDLFSQVDQDQLVEGCQVLDFFLSLYLIIIN